MCIDCATECVTVARPRVARALVTPRCAPPFSPPFTPRTHTARRNGRYEAGTVLGVLAVIWSLLLLVRAAVLKNWNEVVHYIAQWVRRGRGVTAAHGLPPPPPPQLPSAAAFFWSLSGPLRVVLD
jgi:hypothetical protein